MTAKRMVDPDFGPVTRIPLVPLKLNLKTDFGSLLVCTDKDTAEQKDEDWSLIDKLFE